MNRSRISISIISGFSSSGIDIAILRGTTCSSDVQMLWLEAVTQWMPNEWKTAGILAVQGGCNTALQIGIKKLLFSCYSLNINHIIRLIYFTVLAQYIPRNMNGDL